MSPVKPGYPPALWVIGGPGSNKAALVTKALVKYPNWTHFSVGGALRAAAESGNSATKQAVQEGELVGLDVVLGMVESHMAANMGCEGVIIDGFPRNMQQATEFENKVRISAIFFTLFGVEALVEAILAHFLVLVQTAAYFNLIGLLKTTIRERKVG